MLTIAASAAVSRSVLAIVENGSDGGGSDGGGGWEGGGGGEYPVPATTCWHVIATPRFASDPAARPGQPPSFTDWVM